MNRDHSLLRFPVLMHGIRAEESRGQSRSWRQFPRSQSAVKAVEELLWAKLGVGVTDSFVNDSDGQVHHEHTGQDVAAVARGNRLEQKDQIPISLPHLGTSYAPQGNPNETSPEFCLRQHGVCSTCYWSHLYPLGPLSFSCPCSSQVFDSLWPALLSLCGRAASGFQNPLGPAHLENPKCLCLHILQKSL